MQEQRHQAGASADPTPGRRTRLQRVLLLWSVPPLAVVAAVAVWLNTGRYVATENAYVKTDIAQVSPEVAGRVAEVLVRDHAIVKAADVLVRLDREPFEIALARAEAEADAARAQVRTLLATYREAITELADAENRSEHLKAQLNRQRMLAVRGVASTSKLEETQDASRAAEDRIALAKAKIERTLAALGHSPDRPVDQHPLVREKLSAKERARLDLDRTVITAPVSGQAVNVRLQPGEQVRVASVMFAIVSETQPWVEANFKETDLTHVRPGQPATVVLDIYPDVTWTAEVESISPATGAEFALLPPQNASGNWVKVVQRLPVRVRLLPSANDPPLRAGMTATVRIDTGRERQLADLFGWTALARVEPPR